jgi:hypothetical protein
MEWSLKRKSSKTEQDSLSLLWFSFLFLRSSNTF